METPSQMYSGSSFTSQKLCKVATANINQWALDFDGNLSRILESIYCAKSLGCSLRVGPELEISGYSCEDHFLEEDTYLHAYQSLASILNCDATDDILCDIGCPILFNGTRYNCRVFCLNRKIILIRPKMDLADDGNYRERRFFSSWKKGYTLVDFVLPEVVNAASNQISVPFGVGMIQASGVLIAAEICEELWSPRSPHIDFALAGAHIITNGSGSHHQLRKLSSRLALIQGATSKCGGLYLYSNQRGCDGNRLYFDGCSLICLNGELLAQASQFSLKDVEVIATCVDLTDVVVYRQGSASFQHHSSTVDTIPIVQADFSLTRRLQGPVSIATPIPARVHSPEEECAMGPACWLWDYLRRSGAAGFLLPLSGGADSSSVAGIVRVMCGLAVQEAREGNAAVVRDIDNIISRSVAGSVAKESLLATSVTPESLCSYVLHTVYLGSENSSAATQRRSLELSQSIGAYHKSLVIDPIVSAFMSVFSILSGGKMPRFECHGGSRAEDLALQNIQARIRMVLAYLCAQLLPWLRGNSGYLLVLGSANVDEALRGYMTKYDCSSADVNPIGGICKGDLKKMLAWISKAYNLPILNEIAYAPPTAELRPIAEGEVNDYTQTDEEDMGMSYAELGIFGVLRKIHRCGPVTMFLKLLQIWPTLTPTLVAEKVKRFFFFYSINRHKMTTLTPSYHAESYSPDDNRFDLRQFLYNAKWSRQFNTIDGIVKEKSS